MTQYLEKVASPQVLENAWHFIRHHHGGWGCGESIEKIQSRLPDYLDELSEQLLTGTYHPDAMCCYVNIGQGKGEVTCFSSLCDQLVQHAILTVLTPLGKPIFNNGLPIQQSPNAALVKVRDLVRSGYDWLGVARLENCIDYIPYEPLLKNLYKLCGDKMLVGIVRDILNSYPIEFRLLEKKGKGLPQNLILTPWLSELYLHQFDNFLFHKDIVLVRVREEFAVFAQDKAAAQQALTIAAKQLKKLGLELNPEQSQVIRSSAEYTFLGKRLPNIEPWLPLKNGLKQLRGYGTSFQSNMANWLNTVRESSWLPRRLKNEPPVFDDWEVEK